MGVNALHLLCMMEAEIWPATGLSTLQKDPPADVNSMARQANEAGQLVKPHVAQIDNPKDSPATCKPCAVSFALVGASSCSRCAEHNGPLGAVGFSSDVAVGGGQRTRASQYTVMHAQSRPVDFSAASFHAIAPTRPPKGEP